MVVEHESKTEDPGRKKNVEKKMLLQLVLIRVFSEKQVSWVSAVFTLVRRNSKLTK